MNSIGRPRSLRATHRSFAFVVALLWCAAPVLAVLHASAEAHRYCAQHGTVEDAGGGEPAVPLSAAPTLADHDGQPSHDDCAFARFCRFGQLLDQSPPDAVGGVPEASLHAPTLPGDTPSVAVIVIAPKTSPPA